MSKNYLREDVHRRSEVLQSVSVSEDDLRRDVRIFIDWARQQKHLPQDDLNDHLFVERLLLNNKFRIEQSKIKFDNYFTMKSSYSYFYSSLWKVKPLQIPVVRIPLKKLSDDGKWIVLICARNNNVNNSDLLECIKFHTLVTEMMNKYCYADGRIVVLDFKGLGRNLFENFEISLIHKHLKIMKTCFSGRTKAFHILNLTNWGSLLLAGIKLLFRGESTKIHIHENLESLYKEVPKSYLPKDYGGEDISVEEYLETWTDIIKEEEAFLRDLELKLPDEALRPQTSSNSFGVDGTFKKLNID